MLGVTLVRMLVTLCCSAVSEELEEGANDVLVEKDSSAVSEGDKLLLEAYHHSWDDAKVDLDLVLSLLHLIHSAKRDGESRRVVVVVVDAHTDECLCSVAAVMCVCVWVYENRQGFPVRVSFKISNIHVLAFKRTVMGFIGSLKAKLL